MKPSFEVQRSVFASMGYLSVWGTAAAYNPNPIPALDKGAELFPVDHSALQRTHAVAMRVRSTFRPEYHIRMTR
jgi:hypothetical protein